MDDVSRIRTECGLRYYHNYRVSAGNNERIYYGGVPQILQTDEHCFMDSALCEHFTVLMGIAWSVFSRAAMANLLTNSPGRLYQIALISTTSLLRLSSIHIMRNQNPGHLHSTCILNKLRIHSTYMLSFATLRNGVMSMYSPYRTPAHKMNDWNLQLRRVTSELLTRDKKSGIMHVRSAVNSF
jgi:hypothetical protein